MFRETYGNMNMGRRNGNLSLQRSAYYLRNCLRFRTEADKVVVRS